MSIGISEEHAELAASLRKWAAATGGIALLREAETDAAERFAPVWEAACEMGIPVIGLPEAAGGGGGSVLDVAVALEACARELVPGPLLGAAVAALLLGGTAGVAQQLAAGAVVGVGLTPSLRLAPGDDGVRLVGTVDVVWDAYAADSLLLGSTDDRWYVVPASAAEVRPALALDLSRRVGAVTVDLPVADALAVPELSRELLRRTAVTLGAAEAAGVARWCLQAAVDHARVREQFGQPIGRFQAVKHLCAEMLETAEAVTAAAWDAASASADTGDTGDTGAAVADEGQWAFAADVAAVTAFDGAVEVAKSCIQVLGGIGFTFEHDAHLYLRRALALRAQLGDADRAARRLAARAVAGTRRRASVDLAGRDAGVRQEVRDGVARIAALPEPERRAALVDAGYLTPHWPPPYGLGADPVTQLVIDQELARAGVERPDIVIAGWALPTILEHGTDEQRERLVLPSLRGELVWCQLFSEPEAGSDLASLRTRAVRAPGGWRLTGQKVWTSVADRADWGICLARTNPHAPQHRGISYFLVDMRSEGIEVRPLREITGEALFNEVFLDEVFVPDDCVVGEVDDGWRLARTTLANERVAIASTRLDNSTERAVAIAAAGDLDEPQRVQVGRSVALATVCTLLGVRTALRSLAGQGPGPESSVAKLLGVRNRQDSAELVTTLLGERLLTDDPGVRAAVWETLNTRCLSIAGGTTQILRNVAAERILGLPR